MQNVRLFLFAALAMLLLLAWTEWQQDYPSTPGSQAERTASSDTSAQRPAPAATEQGKAQDDSATPETGPPGDQPGEGKASAGEAGGQTIRVTTDLLAVDIDTRGGVLSSASLLQHSVSSNDPTPFQLLQTAAPMFVAETGLVGDDFEAPDHRSTWRSAQDQYRLGDGADELVVPLVWTGENGLRVERRYIFRRDSYVVTVEYIIRNNGAQPRRLYEYAQLRRHETDSGQSFIGARSFVGGAIYTPAEKYQKYGFDDLRETPISRTVSNGWLAMIQHYFLAAWIPPRDTKMRLYSRVDGGDYILGMSSPWAQITPGSSATLSDRLYLGPKDQDRLDAVADGLELTVDYGWLTVISKPLFIALSWIHGIVGNWGWAIIILTMLIKLAFYKLSETSYRSMARMRKLQPRMQQLKERFGEDKQRMNQELMQLYKEEKVNPLGGCLPIVIQIPVFIALYWVLLGSVELRQAPWILWIQDLSTRDPYYVLPVIMGATMFLQQKLNPAPMDPIQQKVMMALPLVFSVFFMFFPAGLVLYWITNNSLSILQQWVITRRIQSSPAAASGDASKAAHQTKGKAKAKSSKGKAKGGSGNQR